MPYIVKGWNDFYEGWLARCLEQQKDGDQGESWQDGWDMGNETDDTGRMIALCEEIKIGQSGIAKPQPHIIVHIEEGSDDG